MEEWLNLDDVFWLLYAEIPLGFQSGWASSNVVGIICPLVVVGLTELPAHPLAAAMIFTVQVVVERVNSFVW